MIVAGIDIGSVAAKAVVVEGTTILGSAIQPTGWNVREAGEQVLRNALKNAHLSRCARVVATGYGRISLDFADAMATEITCHALGAHALFPTTDFVLDIGGQDSKVIRIGPDGRVLDFLMNDKCAAGTGRFLQLLAGVLGMDVSELDAAAAKGHPVSISSQCAVFAETEIVGLLAKGTQPADVAAGVFVSIVQRMQGLAGRLNVRCACTFTGGLAHSRYLARLLEAQLHVSVHVPEEPQLVGALGAAILAAREPKEKRHARPLL